MMGKFTSQLKELPGAVDMMAPTSLQDTPQRYSSITTTSVSPSTPAPVREERDGEHLRIAQALLEREVARTDLGAHEAEALREVLFGLREKNLGRVASVYRDAFSELSLPSESLRSAYEHLDQYFA